MSFDEIVYDKNNEIATTTFNRPERLNALTSAPSAQNVRSHSWRNAILISRYDNDTRGSCR
jgi:1,4-dihydroxy-2-naphthoyl-CoA synthase